MIDWTSNIPIGTSIDSIKKIQPNFIEIDWQHPAMNNGETRYTIIKIKNNYDVMKMENYLSFVENKYRGRFAHK